MGINTTVPKLAPELGKYYALRDGTLVGPIKENARKETSYVWKAVKLTDNTTMTWTADGSYVGTHLTHKHDIVNEALGCGNTDSQNKPSERSAAVLRSTQAERVNIRDAYLRFDWAGYHQLVSIRSILEGGNSTRPLDFMELVTEELLDSDGVPLLCRRIPKRVEASADRHDRRARSIAQSLIRNSRIPHEHDEKCTPFVEELTHNATEFLTQARAGQGVSLRISLSNAVQSITLPRATAGAPEGGNRAWQFRRMVRAAIMRSPQWKKDEDTLLP